MQVLSNLLFKGSGPVLESLTVFPSAPTLGQMCLVLGIVYIYTELGGITTWYPLSNETSYFIHTQGLASTDWVIEHNLNTTNFIFFVYDDLGNLIEPTFVPLDDDKFGLHFTTAKIGKAVVFVAAERYAPVNTSNPAVYS